ncbi:hypothetical protein OQA88_208 [Cercophora sp. LCS_1]
MKFGFASALLSAALMAGSALADSYPWERLDKDKAVLVIVDIQEGLFSLVRDWDPTAYRHNILAFASIATAFPSIPVIITTSAQNGPNGLTPSEILDFYPNAPVIQRQGEVNAWDSAEFRAALNATGKRQVILAGIVTEVCTAFLARSLRAEGYSVWACLEASGTSSPAVRDIANYQMLRAGVNVVSYFAILGDLMRDWRNTPGAKELFPYLDKWFPASAMVVRAHRAAIENGTLLPGETDLPL